MSIQFKNGMTANDINNELNKCYDKMDTEIIIKHLFKIEENEDITIDFLSFKEALNYIPERSEVYYEITRT